jgi:hypothetical protein
MEFQLAKDAVNRIEDDFQDDFRNNEIVERVV